MHQLKPSPTAAARTVPRLSLLATFVLILATAGAGCRRDARSDSARCEPPRRTVRAAAASDLQFVLPEVLAHFEQKHPDIAVEVTFGSSGNFYAQLANKAPFDVFLSADAAYPSQLVESGLAMKGSQFVYAEGRIVIWVSQSSPLDLEALGIKALIDPSVKEIAIANPRHAPYGRIAEAAMKNLGVYDEVKERLVLGDNVAQAAQFIASGAADAGIIALSLAMAPTMRAKGKHWLIPRDSYPKLEQSGVVLSWAADGQAAEDLCAFLRGNEAQTILREFGFHSAGE
ncbi:MAG: molybdate ABC transporter substrate-binding protein [Planctomycetia bacterium]|nr:molybdate ABC transporter substrate-binding protein [Planctomycetia bacterium]